MNTTHTPYLKAVTAFVLIIIIAIIFTLRFNYINKQYPEANFNAHNIGEAFTYEDLTFTVEKFNIINDDELKQFGKTYSDLKANDDDEIKAIELKLSILNETNLTKKINVYNFETECVGWSQGVSMELFSEINENKTLSPTLNPNEQVSLTLLFTISHYHFNSSDWKNIESQKFDYVMSLYPNKNYVKLNY